jgi:hypothetical protein
VGGEKGLLLIRLVLFGVGACFGRWFDEFARTTATILYYDDTNGNFWGSILYLLDPKITSTQNYHGLILRIPCTFAVGLSAPRGTQHAYEKLFF